MTTQADQTTARVKQRRNSRAETRTRLQAAAARIRAANIRRGDKAPPTRGK